MSLTKQTILETVPKYVEGMYKLHCMLTTKRMIYQMMKIKRHNEPHLFSDKDWVSTYGTLRSMLSEICKNKEKVRIDGLLTFNSRGVDYFYTDEEQIKTIATQNNDKVNFFKPYEPQIRKHCNIQYELCGIFSKLGYKVWTPKQDSTGEQNKTKYNNKTIYDEFKSDIVDMNSKDVFYWIDFVVFDGNKPILQVEVEESTNVISGMERMSNSKEEKPKIKSYVSSTSTNYEKKFKTLSEGTYKDLSATFIQPKKIESLYKKSLKVGDDINKLESFRSTVWSVFNLK